MMKIDKKHTLYVFCEDGFALNVMCFSKNEELRVSVWGDHKKCIRYSVLNLGVKDFTGMIQQIHVHMPLWVRFKEEFDKDGSTSLT